MQKRILIDGRFVGVGDSQTRYVLELVKGILSLDKNNEYTLLIRPVGVRDTCDLFEISNGKFLASNQLKSSNFESEIKELNKSIKLKNNNLQLKLLDIKHYSLGEQTKLLKYLNAEKFDLVHFTQFNHPVRYHGKYVITIQDLTLIGHLHRQNIIKSIAFKKVMKSAAKDSAKIIAISKTTINDLIDFYNVPKDKFEIIYHGVDHKQFNLSVKSKANEIKNFKAKFDITGEYILYTGMWKRHKNILRMLKAFELFKTQHPDSNIQLVLVGRIDKKEPEVIKEIERINNKLNEEYSIHNAVVTTGFVAEEELPIAYAGAFAYCIPSLSEGFGWPPLEAMACGTPVIASSESSIPEICGKAPLYFGAYNIKDMAEKMAKVTTDVKLRKELIKKGLEQVQKYHWEETAEKTLRVYKDLLGQ